MSKPFFTFSVCCILFLTLCHQANAAPTDPVSIPDTALRAFIESKLSKTSGATITEQEMSGMTGELSANYVSGTKITNLTGLEYATNINRLYLWKHSITNIGPLKGLTKLIQINLWRNNIVDITALKDLTALTTLDLGENEIVDLTPLQNLPVLNQLILQTNKITNVGPLKNLTSITSLNLQKNTNLSAISPLSGLRNLVSLALSSTSVTASGLSTVLPYFSSLEVLQLNFASVSNLSVLNTLPSTVKLGNLALQSMSDSSLSLTHSGLLLKDISPLVTLMKAGKFKTGATVNVSYNWNLDYDSFYTHIPALIAGGFTVGYKTKDPGTNMDEDPEPGLQRVSEANTVGRALARYTFVVQASNRMDNYFFRLNSDTVNYGPASRLNTNFKGMPVTWTVTYPDGSTSAPKVVKTGNDGLSRFAVTLGSHGEVYTLDAVVPEKQNTDGPSHAEFRVSFTVTADRDAPPPPGSRALTVTFEDYPEKPPTEEFPLTIRFSEPVTGFEKDDITVETELQRGTGTATLEALTPLRGPRQRYVARIGVPARAVGTVKLIVHPGAATSSISRIIGPTIETPSEPIEFGRRRFLFPSHVPMDRIIFNEFRNTENDTHDWIELKNISDEEVSLKEWEISMVASEGEHLNTDRDIVGFPDYTLPPDGILLIVNTHPRGNDLLRGQDIENPNHNPKLRAWYLIRPEMKLPQTPYLLILRSARDKNGKWEDFEDLVGDYYRHDVGFRTQIWPLRDTWVYTGTEARFSQAEVYQRVMRPKNAIPMKPMERGYFHDAWVLSDYQSGLGYDPKASPETSLGTPGYATLMEDDVGTGHISFSEVMFATNKKGSPSQWVELYNNSATDIVDLEGWKLVSEVRDSQPVHWYITFHFKSLEVMPNQTALLVTRNNRNSGNIPMRRIYNVQRQSRKALLLHSEGFALRLFSPDGTLVDMVGNLDGRVGEDKPRWELPSGWSESGARSSLIRRYEDRVPWQGTVPESWVRAVETALIGPYTYWGLEMDNGTPGYRQGSPLPVTLSSFRADLRDGSVVVNWTTASEMDNAGFYVLRSGQSGSGFVRVSPALIPGAGTTADRQTYTYRDTTAQRNVPYYYRLEEVSLSGERRAVATVRLRGYVSAANKALWKWGDVKSSD
jgi:hypothetical protein